MKVLVTGAKGFVGKNLCWALKNIQAGKDKTHPGLTIEAVYEYDLDSTPEELDTWCRECDFVFNLAGVNRPQNQEEFMQATLFPGSSGGVVISKPVNIAVINGKIAHNPTKQFVLLGVYSGEPIYINRVEVDDMVIIQNKSFGLGNVWYAHLIPEIIGNGILHP